MILVASLTMLKGAQDTMTTRERSTAHFDKIAPSKAS
jgi:hypothetical protein